MPKYIQAAINSAFRGKEFYFWPEFYEINSKGSDWLTKKLGLTSDCNETQLNGFTFRYSWNCNKWFVRS